MRLIKLNYDLHANVLPISPKTKNRYKMSYPLLERNHAEIINCQQIIPNYQ